MTRKVGVTATRKGMSQKQKDKFTEIIKDLKPYEFHDGDCLGGDREAHMIVRGLFRGCYMKGHPPEDDTHRAFSKYDMWWPPTPYLERNHRIVDVVDIVVACPKQMKEPKTQRGGGTWATVRYARKVGRNLTIIYPDGTIGV